MRTLTLRRLHRCRHRCGATAVEFAMVLPVILLLFFGALEMNNLNFIKQTAANAAYEGARAAMVAGGNPERGRQHAETLLDRMGVGNGAVVSVGGSGQRVTVTVRVPLNLNSAGLSRFTRNLNVTEVCSLGRESRQPEP
jgi:Flp pilus assembly protein TadG